MVAHDATNNDNSSMSASCKQICQNAHSLRDELTKCLKKAKRPANNMNSNTRAQSDTVADRLLSKTPRI